MARLATDDGRACLKIVSRNAPNQTIQLLVIANPAVTARFYSVSGEVKYDMTDGSGYLEMWNGFGTNRYFAPGRSERPGRCGKSLESPTRGPLFCSLTGAEPPDAPTQLDLNLVLNGRGEVLVGPLKLVQYPQDKSVEGILGPAAGAVEKKASVRPTPVTVDGRSCLKVENTTGLPVQIPLAVLTNPAVTGRFYSVSGEIKYDGVERGRLFGNVECLPQRTIFLARAGTRRPDGQDQPHFGMAVVLLPFDRKAIGEIPTQLEINLALPGRGTVYVGPIKFGENPEWNKYPDSAGIADVVRQELYSYGWWSFLIAWKATRTGLPLILLLACLTGWLAHKGKARGFVMAATGAGSALGVLAALAAVAAPVAGQPWWVWFPAGFFAMLLLAIFPLQRWRYRKRYGALELRRMASLDQLRV